MTDSIITGRTFKSCSASAALAADMIKVQGESMTLATGISVDVFGARPAFTGSGKFRIGSEGFLLVGAGFSSVANSGGTTTFTMVSAGTAWPYLTFGYDDNIGSFMGLVGARDHESCLYGSSDVKESKDIIG